MGTLSPMIRQRALVSSFRRLFSSSSLRCARAFLATTVTFPMESGFSRKSKAPSLVALTAASIEPWPLITTTTGRSSKGISWMRDSTSMPSMPGSQMSSSTSSKPPPGSIARQASPLSAVSTA